MALYGIEIDTSANNVPIAFDETAGSLVGQDLPAASRVVFINDAIDYIAFTIGRYTQAPSSVLSVTRAQGWVPGSGHIAMDEYEISNKSKLYIRAANGKVIKNGMIRIFLWIRR